MESTSENHIKEECKAKIDKIKQYFEKEQNYKDISYHW